MYIIDRNKKGQNYPPANNREKINGFLDQGCFFLLWLKKEVKTGVNPRLGKLYADINICIYIYSETSLKRTPSKADTSLRWTV